MACKYCQPKAPMLFHYQLHAPAPAPLSPSKTQPLSLICFTRELYEQPKDRTGTKDKILIYLGNHGLYGTLF